MSLFAVCNVGYVFSPGCLKVHLQSDHVVSPPYPAVTADMWRAGLFEEAAVHS